MENAPEKTMLLGDILLQKGWILPEYLELALSDQKLQERPAPVGEILVKRGLIPSKLLYQALAIQFGKKFVELSEIKIQPQVLKLVPKYFVSEYNVMPIGILQDTILAAISDPLDVWPLSQLQKITGLREVETVVAAREDIKASIDKHYSS